MSARALRVFGDTEALDGRTLTAVKRNAVRLGCDSVIVSATHIALRGAGAVDLDLYAIDDRWMIATYSEAEGRYRSDDRDARHGGLYAWALTLAGLRAKGVRTYLTPARALATVKR